MNIEAFLLCDAATNQQGKLNVLGAFDVIYSKNLPAIHPACSVVTRIRFDETEQGQHHVEFFVVDENKKSICPKLEAKVNVRIAGNMNSAAINLVLNIQRLKLEKYGNYKIDMAINGKSKINLPFFVVSPTKN